MLYKVLLICMKILLLISLLIKVCFSQTNLQVSVIEANRTLNCEYVSAIFDSFVNSFSTDKTIIVISYLGKNESEKEIATKRLHNAEKYLTEYYKGSRLLRSPDKVISAIGVDKTEEGKLDFYVEGKLRLTILFLKNRNFRIPPCYVDPDEVKKRNL